MTVTAKGYWPMILGPAPPPEPPKHFRVVAGSVDKAVTCYSVEDFLSKVPRASAELEAQARSFFAHGPSGELEVVPNLAPV